MKKIYILLLLSGIFVLRLSAAEIAAGDKPGSEITIDVTDLIIDDTNNIVVSLDLDFSKVNLQRNKETVYIPMYVNGPDTLRLTSFSLAGHNRYIWSLRNGQEVPLLFKGWGGNRGELSLQSNSEGPGYLLIGNENNTVNYKLTLSAPYQDWMESSTFIVEAEKLGCASCINGKETIECPIAAIDFRPTNFMTEFLFVTPAAEEVKTRELSLRAFVDFKVNRTNILPSYRNNRAELAKITASIDSVKNDKDITVTSISIKGTASPEGPYQNNVYLAKNRTQSLKDYVTNLYSFPQDFIKTSYEPVDWAGLKEWLENNQIENREAILAIVNGDLEPYARNLKIKTTYPTQYQYLLQNVYPSLRHSDYVIEYSIRNYTNVDEIIEVMQTTPQKLSLNELFVVAGTQPEGSELYNESFEIAVNLYPEDEIANLNAGTASLMRGDLSSAKKYLEKSGNSEEARYMKAEYEAINGDKEGALQIFKQLAVSARSEKVRQQSERAVESLEASLKQANKKFRVL